MCGYNMSDVQGLQVKANPAYVTYFSLTECSFGPRTDVCGTHLHCRLNAHLDAAIGDDPGIASAERWFRGTIGGQYIAFRWKASGDYMAAGDYSWVLDFDISYISGVVDADIYCCNGNGVTGSASTPVWPADTTATIAPGTAPNIFTNIRLDGSLDITDDYLHARTLSWADGFGATGGTKSCSVYYWYAGLAGWTLLKTVGGTSTTVDPSVYNIPAGVYVAYNCVANGLYGSSGVPAEYPVYRRSAQPTAPTPPTTLTESATTIKFRESVVLAWSGATPGVGSIQRYKIYVRRFPKGQPWIPESGPAYAFVGYWGNLPASLTPSDFSGFMPGDGVQFKITTFNDSGTESVTGIESDIITLTGGAIRVYAGGAWHMGDAHIKVSGVWKPAIGIYRNVDGVWKEGI